MRAAIIAAILFAITGPASAAEPTANDRFSLWNECGPVGLWVGVKHKGDKIGLTKSAVETAARSRLRAARLYTSDPDAPVYLAIVAQTVGKAFSHRVGLNKPVDDVKSDVRWEAETWARGGLGTHGGDPSYIVGHVSQYVDSFIDEYLRVNDAACSKR